MRPEGSTIERFYEWQRTEKKYSVSTTMAYCLLRRLQAVLREDAHNGPDGYDVRSLYFDTVRDDDYFDKVDGLEQRRKIRLRVYPPDFSFVKLESKEKCGAYQRKRALSVSADDARALIAKNYGVLLRMGHPLAAELFCILSGQAYMPRCIVEYRRRALLAPYGDPRLTFDSQLKARDGSDELFAPDPGLYPATSPDDVTLEVKYSHFLFGYIRDSLGGYAKLESSVSTYCLARRLCHD
jgi:hypothetical protein